MNIERWAERQRAAMIDAGVHPLDAYVAVQWVIDNLPPGEDPDTWIPAQTYINSVLYGVLSESVDDAKATWYTNDGVPQRFRFILDATSVADEDEANDYNEEVAVGIIYFWLKNRRQYFRSNPLVDIPMRRLQALLNNLVSANSQSMSEVVGGVYDGDIAYAVWIKHMQVELRRAGLQYRALGGGGWDQLTIASFLAVDVKLVSDYNFLREFAESVLDGSVSRPQADNRVDMYFGNARTNYFDEWSADPVIPDEDMTWIEIRYLGNADHCDDCIIYWNMGFQMEGVLPRPHEQCACNRKCRCALAGRQVPTSEVSFWIGSRRDATGEIGANEPRVDTVKDVIKKRKSDNDKKRKKGQPVSDWVSNRIADDTKDD